MSSPVRHPLQIAFLNKELPSDAPNGVSVQVHRLAEALVKRGHGVTCFSFSRPAGNEAYDTVNLGRLPHGALARKFAPAVAFRKVGGGGFDIVHYHGDDYLCPGSRKRVRTFYGSALDEALSARNLRRMAYQGLFYLFEWASCLRRGRKVGISRTTLRALPMVRRSIPCGVPLDRYKPGETKTPYPSILFIGDIDSRKQGRRLLHAFRCVISPREPSARLRIVGPQQCNETHVTSLGNVSEEQLIAEYQRAWILCIPSAYEGFGVPAIEAMACGTAVVSTCGAGVKEVLRDGETAVLCEWSGLGDALLRVMRERTLKDRLVANGRDAVQAFGMDRIAELYENVYTGRSRDAG